MDLAAVRRWWPLAAVLVLLFVTSLAATRSSPQLDQIHPDATPTTPPLLPKTQPSATNGAQQPPEAARGLPEWLGTAALYLLVLVALVVVALVVWAIVRDQARRRARKGRRGTTPARHGARTAEELVAALDAGLEELSDTDRDPRRAVIACWVRLEQAAAAAGTPRNPGDSPTDLVGRLLREQRVDAQVLAALLEVYREARYATHTVDDQMRRQARSALERLRADLGAAAAADGGAGVSDGGLDDLFSFRDDPVEEAAEPVVKKRSTGLWILRNVLLIAAATAVTVAALRAGNMHISLLLIIAFFVGLRLVLFAMSQVAPPSQPKRRAGGSTSRNQPDSLRAAVRRWERSLDRAHSDPDLYARNVLPALAELADERLRLRHGITRATDPRRARELLGDPLWAALHDRGRRTARSSELESYVIVLERL